MRARRARARAGRRRAAHHGARGSTRSAISCPGPALAHKASDEGIIAVEDAAGLATHPLSYVDIPRATFCTPNVGSFGLTEEQAREQGYEVVVGKVPYGAVGGGIVYGDRAGLVKLVGESRYGELLGGHIVGARATELIQELVNVRALEGGYPEVARIVHGHPTLSEAVMEAGACRGRLADPRLRATCRAAGLRSAHRVRFLLRPIEPARLSRRRAHPARSAETRGVAASTRPRAAR